jgi:2,3,4,5-tetrahydropyridine-2-carboxylate N-succinyltransferase
MSKSELHSFGFGVVTRNSANEIIEVYYPQPVMHPELSLASALMSICGSENNTIEINDIVGKKIAAALQHLPESRAAKSLSKLVESSQSIILCLIAADSPPQTIAEAYLKLHLLSHRLCKPHDLNLDGMFGVLRNLAWTNEGAIDLDDLPARQLDARLAGNILEVSSVDKFPKMTDYIVPRGVRIAHTARVRLGAYLGEGTTIMHEGFVNFNAGTEGVAMIEGRISAGVVVGDNSDLGGGCSTMGTLSGGGKEIISVGKNCLIGANAGIGFPLADGCIVEAGLYVTAGTKVNLLDGDGTLIKTAKAKEICLLADRLYRRNSLSGAVESVPLRTTISLNDDLHSHN